VSDGIRTRDRRDHNPANPVVQGSNSQLAAEGGDAVTHALEAESTRLLVWIKSGAGVGNLELDAFPVASA
jgi:hypothetical protein